MTGTASPGSALDVISARLAELRRQIDDACRRAGRAPGSARLLAVSKTKPVEAIRAAYAAGQREFGENYAQELDEKATALADLPGIRWHAIGQLQRNKVKLVVKSAAVVQAIDREELAIELDRRAGAIGRTLEGMVEVNVAGESSKGGCSPDRLGALLAAIGRCSHLRVVGLMAIPPAADDPEASRPFFAALRALRDEHGGVAALPELSMGMSHDFAVAVEEGATLVRIGTALFGSRS